MLEITITDVDENPKPTITSNNGGDAARVNVTENSTLVTTVTATHTNQGQTITYSISGGADQAKFSINSSTGRLAFATAPDYENPTDSDNNNTYIVEVAAIDSNNASDTQTITVSITNFNEHAPEITRPVNTTTYSASFAETYDFTNPVANMAATDRDFDTVTFSITGGTDQDKFTLGTLGRLLFKTAPKYSEPSDSDTNNTYIVALTASDGRGKSDTITITINITGENKHSPIIMQPDTMETYSTNIPEDFDFSNQVTSVYANDEDMGQTVSYSITGGSDQALFTMDNFGGVVFKTAPDFENPTDSDGNNSYIIEVTANDGNGGTDKITLTINITDVDGH
jgi:ribosomal protein S6E (S10)